MTSPVNYVVEEDGDPNNRQTVHIQRMKPFYERKTLEALGLVSEDAKADIDKAATTLQEEIDAVDREYETRLENEEEDRQQEEIDAEVEELIKSAANHPVTEIKPASTEMMGLKPTEDEQGVENDEKYADTEADLDSRSTDTMDSHSGSTDISLSSSGDEQNQDMRNENGGISANPNQQGEAAQAQPRRSTRTGRGQRTRAWYDVAADDMDWSYLLKAQRLPRSNRKRPRQDA